MARDLRVPDILQREAEGAVRKELRTHLTDSHYSCGEGSHRVMGQALRCARIEQELGQRPSALPQSTPKPQRRAHSSCPPLLGGKQKLI